MVSCKQMLWQIGIFVVHTIHDVTLENNMLEAYKNEIVDWIRIQICYNVIINKIADLH